jgi:hypothetical protein
LIQNSFITKRMILIFRPSTQHKVTKLCQSEAHFNLSMTMGKAFNKRGKKRGGEC